jgi:single-strand DNA-binding protein
MSNINLCHLEGNIVRDPEVDRVGANDTVLCKFSIANNVYAGQNKDDYVNYFDLNLWGKRAESLSPYLKKGMRVHVLAEARQERWEDKDSGKGRAKITFTVQTISLPPKGSSGEQSSAPVQKFDTPDDEIPF